MKKVLQFFAILFLVGLPFLLMESWLRLSHFNSQFPFKEHPSAGYILQPHYQGMAPKMFNSPRPIAIQINSIGLRAPEINPTTPANLTRIIVLGDDGVFGLGVREEHTFSNLTQKILNDNTIANYHYQVINAGIPGYSSYQSLQLLKHNLLNLNPNVVIVYLGWNDHRISWNGRPDREHFLLIHRSLLHRLKTSQFNILSQTFTYQWFLDSLLQIQIESQNKKKWHLPKTQKTRVPIEQFANNLREIIQLAKNNGFGVLFITQPHGYTSENLPKKYLTPSQLNQKEGLLGAHKQYNETVRKVAEESNIVLLDLEKFFSQSDASSLMEKDGILPNRAGNRIIAFEIAKALRHFSQFKPRHTTEFREDSF